MAKEAEGTGTLLVALAAAVATATLLVVPLAMSGMPEADKVVGWSLNRASLR